MEVVKEEEEQKQQQEEEEEEEEEEEDKNKWYRVMSCTDTSCHTCSSSSSTLVSLVEDYFDGCLHTAGEDS